MQPVIKAVLFDMDGTLLVPVDDGIAAFKDKWGIAQNDFISPGLSKLPLEAELEFIAIEANLAKNSQVRPGIHELLYELIHHEIAIAMVTNNSSESANTVLTAHGLPFGVVRTRHEGPHKPNPDLIFQALDLLNVDVSETIFVGDTSADSGAAQAAKLKGCFLFAEAWNEHLEQEHEVTPIKRVKNVDELRKNLIKSGLKIHKTS